LYFLAFKQHTFKAKMTLEASLNTDLSHFIIIALGGRKGGQIETSKFFKVSNWFQAKVIKCERSVFSEASKVILALNVCCLKAKKYKILQAMLGQNGRTDCKAAKAGKGNQNKNKTNYF
jgi:hypothetical protein